MSSEEFTAKERRMFALAIQARITEFSIQIMELEKKSLWYGSKGETNRANEAAEKLELTKVTHDEYQALAEKIKSIWGRDRFVRHSFTD